MPDTFHLLVPYAASSALPAQQALQGLALPHLSKLLARLQAEAPDEGDEFTLTPPHERALARALGLPHADGLVPWAAWERLRAGQAPDGQAWAFVAPAPWHVGTGQVTLGEPAALQLDEAASRDLLAIVAPFFAEDGIALVYERPTRWLARGEPLRGLPTASPDRVTGRSIDIWQPAVPQTRPLRRLQSEIQMLLYTHAFNEAREAARLPQVNGFWLHGAGALDDAPAGEQPTVAPALREAALREDWSAWSRAWQALDAAEVADALARAGRGEPVRITLCGERRAQSFAGGAAHPFGQRLRGLFTSPAPARSVLEHL
ncbi:phosphoglycerate mutase [Xylophilus sp.]|uniref:phosphoglycerate mutase n=1 Tax=Xylophilus sp. TaxID=2653893 RepID=UPI0013B80E4B|nr:phosphoglycerate mutase [Xylophilus sp.]KAF1043135.1 MAG: hypothetical protein GAK38_04089 [Xylophilus sp.]